MDTRLILSSVLVLLVGALVACTVLARRSNKAIGSSVAWLDAALIPPILGNLIIIISRSEMLTAVGCYIYFVGMDVVLFALMNFTCVYCKMPGKSSKHRKPVVFYTALAADAVQLLLNPFTGHVFGLEAVDVEGSPYYRVIPYAGQTIHRIVDYTVFAAVVAIFIIMAFKSSRIYREKYTIILIAMLVVGLWQTFYIFSRTPIDRSMMGYGVFGLLVFFLAIHYRPLRLLDRMLSNIVSDMSEAMFLFDPVGKCLWSNEQGCRLTGLTSFELENVNERLTEMFGKLNYSSSKWTINTELGSGGEKKYYTIEKRTVLDENDKMTGAVLSIHDKTEEHLRLKRELYAASHDKLTGLYTKEYFYERVRKTLIEGTGEPYIAIFVDVKNFKIVNDVFGTDFGDYAIQCIADLIRDEVSDRAVYGRLAGDTFGIFGIRTVFNAEHIEKTLSRFSVNDGANEHKILIHLGIYEVEPTDRDVSVMFDRAHLALATINDQYKTHLAFYDKNLRESVLWNQKISAELDKAIAEMQVRPYLQAIVDKDGKVVGAEALVRWIHPDRGFMSPASFIPTFEKNGMIVEVDKHMWRCACEVLSRWDNDLFISVNISPRDFYYTDVVANLKELVARYAIKPERLRIEITESVMMSDTDDRMKLLDELRHSGFIVEMDDFGSGYSSLNMLKNMPVDVLKIDMMFLSKTDSYARSETIIRNIVRLSNELGIASLTEGVETKEQYLLLCEMGCNLFQGYYFSKPIPVEDFEKKYLDR